MRLRIYAGYGSNKVWILDDSGRDVELPNVTSILVKGTNYSSYSYTPGHVEVVFKLGFISMPKTQCDFIETEDSKIKAVKAEIDTITTKLAALKEQVSKIGSNG